MAWAMLVLITLADTIREVTRHSRTVKDISTVVAL